MTKIRGPQDSTRRNVRASVKRDQTLKLAIVGLLKRVEACERAIAAGRKTRR
jgi:hypothetical protein